jgi:N-acetylmuramoyl-L-alanine amidase
LTGLLLLGSVAFSQDCDLSGWKLFVDPGHGGSDPGAIGPSGLREKDVTLDVGLQLRDWLEWYGATVGISRTDDVFVPLTTRASLANSFGADRFSSVHMNAFHDPSANGTEVYVVPNPSATTRDLGQQTLDYLVGYLGLRNRGLKFANFTVLVRTSMPAALSESAFISNPFEESLLWDPDFRALIAQAHADGICWHLWTFGGVENSLAAPRFQPLDSYLGSLHVTGLIEGAKPFFDPRFSADGSRLTFSVAGGRFLYEAGLDTYEIRPATASYRPVTNDKILVTRNDYNGSALLVIDLKTQKEFNLSLLGVGRLGAENLGYEGTWSPDGRKVLFSLTRDDGHAPLGSELYLVDYDGRGLTQLTHDGSVKMNPHWSARNQIAFEDAEGRILIAEMPQ